MNAQREIAQVLLQSKAIKLEPSKPFTWASGWKSPIYCDNRKTLSFPQIRGFIRDEFIKVIQQEFKEVEVIAGVATGAIAQAALVADSMELPMAYVRSSAKSHGLENLIEGVIDPGQKVVVLEDLVSTGGSSLKAVEALRKSGADVLGMVAIFSYGFTKANENFEKHQCRLYTLGNYESLLEAAMDSGYIDKKSLSVLEEWRKNPDTWGK